MVFKTRLSNRSHFFMRTYLLLVTCLVLVGCGQQQPDNREVLRKLDEIKNEMASNRPVRWAAVDSRKIESEISQWSYARLEELKTAENLPAEMEQKIREFESISGELAGKRMELMRPGPGFEPGRVQEDPAYKDLMKRMEEARIPIADVLERRAREETKVREKYKVEDLVKEYINDRFDLVVDSSDFPSRGVVYQAGSEVLDITDGVLKLFRQKTKE